MVQRLFGSAEKCLERAGLIDHQRVGLLRGDPHGAPAEAFEVAQARVGADGDAELAGRGNGPLHDQRVAAVEAAGDVGRSDQRQQLVVGAELPIAEALAAVAVDVDAVHAGLRPRPCSTPPPKAAATGRV